MLTNRPAYPLGIAISGAGGRTNKQNPHIRNGRQRRRAYEKKHKALIAAAWKKWGSVEAMPHEEQVKLDLQLARLGQQYLGQ